MRKLNWNWFELVYEWFGQPFGEMLPYAMFMEMCVQWKFYN